ncbi:CobW family GTP-binding protein [Paenibacillus protaetiae]|uniref:GTP-binding protein n=1 Tax=Paenibacillus protaetiae TaxID=2509456 RepID=A0A4V0YF88_9BACL|nr:GTP-binding protein [Paenibacillus protaetiae]QAY66861.1 GTP-binding protein [Paenibacillus protaetiae]
MEQKDALSKLVPVHLLAGFLGSGKTTLLTRIIARCREEGLKAAVIMNELGEVNLDGEMVDAGVPMAEMLGGCICCTIRADLGMQIYNLVQEHQPDVILIESTGAAHPLEMMDGVTEAAMYTPIDLRTVLTVVDGPELLRRSRESRSQTYKLMKEQIRCATKLLLNKTDKLGPEELVEAQQLLHELNAHAPVTPAVRSMIGDWSWLAGERSVTGGIGSGAALQDVPVQEHVCGPDCLHPHDGGHHEAAGEHTAEEHSHKQGHVHHSHEHVMVLTHYMSGPVDSEAFEALLQRLPDNVYRAKGILTFTDTASRFLFQYAYRESDYLRITPQGNVADVAVFIGEHFDKNKLLDELALLESATAASE